MMTRKTRLKFNTVSSLILQLVTFVCGFILPKMYLTYYGSEVNGLISSISQFLTILALADCGVGAVVQAAFYKPLAENDMDQVSRVYVAAERFYNRIAAILLVYIALLCFIFPTFTDGSFSTSYIAALIVVLSIGEISQYLLGLKNIVLLNSAQYGFVRSITSIITIILNTVICVVLMKMNATIHIVRFVSAIVYLARPIVFATFVRRKYKINRKIEIKGQPIKQKWNGLAQHISSVVLGNTDVVVLTIFATLKDVSVYSIYYLIVSGLRQIIVSLTNGIEPLLGDMLVKEDKKLLSTFETFEWIIHISVCTLFTITGLTIVPFVQIYTHGITDANYCNPVFACILTMAIGAYCIRLPYNIITNAAGHFRQTQTSAIVECVLNIVVSILTVIRFGLVGVAVGTLVAMVYRTIYLAMYTSKNILHRSKKLFAGRIFSDCVAISLSVILFNLFQGIFVEGTSGFLSWIIFAVEVGILTIGCELIVNITLNFNQVRILYNAFLRKKSKK